MLTNLYIHSNIYILLQIASKMEFPLMIWNLNPFSISINHDHHLQYGNLNFNAKMKINLNMRRRKSFQKSTQTQERPNLGEFWLSLQWPNPPAMNFQAAAPSVPPPLRRLPPPLPPPLAANLLMISGCRENQLLNFCFYF